MKIKSDYFIYVVSALAFVFVVSLFPLWYFTVRAPQYRVALTFLEGLKRRNKIMVEKSTVPEEFNLYKELYLRNGYNKHLLFYDNLEPKETDGVFYPHRIRFSVLGRENDMLFGERELSYVLSLDRIDEEWKVIQFASLEDVDDLRNIKKYRQTVVVPPSE